MGRSHEHYCPHCRAHFSPYEFEECPDCGHHGFYDPEAEGEQLERVRALRRGPQERLGTTAEGI
jgi:hypothetical protein